jgi:lipopolysaccharide/colanic/teichoic acid biosynthesis glycosyltransferase
MVEVVKSTDARSLHEAALRALNYVVALGGLLVTSPLLLAIAVAIKLDSLGPVLYRQLRVGRDRRQQGPQDAGEEVPNRRTDDLGGRLFRLHKFRTMHQDAEADTGPTWSAPGDDRTTRVGRFLRRHRLDELPQLWNVLKGDMAVVGPRPERPLIFHRLREHIGGYTRRQAVRPGITGWAQINRASDRTFADVERKLRYDLEYLEHRSLGFDSWVMLKTPLVMARPDLVVGSAAPGDARAQATVAGRPARAEPARSLFPRPGGRTHSESPAEVEAHV